MSLKAPTEAVELFSADVRRALDVYTAVKLLSTKYSFMNVFS